jgi:cell division protein FtsL
MKRKNRNINKFRNFLFFLSTGFFLIIYVLLYLKIIYIGYQTNKLKEKYEFLNLLNKNYKLQIIKLTAPENLTKIAREKNINLIVPKNWCFLEIREKNEMDNGNKGILEAETR